MKHEQKLFWFDFLRGCAALMVFTGHLRALMFQSFSEKSSGIVDKLFFFLTGFGHQAVIVFFVLSGFFIIRSIHEATQAGKWNIKEYCKNRLTRLWVVLLPALLLTLLWDTLGLWLVPNATAYTGIIPYMPGLNPTHQLDVITFMGNLFFLQQIAIHTYGSNPALWSLANEFWYYVIFPLLYFSFQAYYKPVVRVLFLLLAILCFLFIGEGISLYFIIWLMGGATYLIVKSEVPILTSSTTVRVMLVLLFFTVLSFIRIKSNTVIFNDYSLGVVTALLMSSLAFAPMRRLYFQRAAIFLSAISYSVYLMHLSFVVFLTSLMHSQGLIWSYLNFGYYLLLLVGVLSYCILMYFLFERNTSIVKKFLSGIRISV